MSPTAIFIIGAIIFGITVYGAVIGGGIALGRIELEQNLRTYDRIDDETAGSTDPE